MFWETKRRGLPCHCGIRGILPRHESFSLRDKVNRGIRLFYEQNFRRADVVVHPAVISTWSLSPLFSRPEKSKRLPPFCFMDFSVCFLNVCDSCIARDGNLVPYSNCVKVKYRIIYNWLVLFPTEYSVLGFSLKDNLIRYKKWGVFHEFTL